MNLKKIVFLVLLIVLLIVVVLGALIWGLWAMR